MGGSPPGSAGVPPAQILPQLRPSPPPESTGSGALPLLRPGPCGSRRQGGRLQHRRETERQPKGQHAGGTPALPGGRPDGEVGGIRRATSLKAGLSPLGNSRLPASRAPAPRDGADHSRKNGRSLMKMNHEWTPINTNRPEDRWTCFNDNWRQNASALLSRWCDPVMGGSPPGSAGVPPAQILPQLQPSPPPESTGSGALPLLRPGPCGSRRQGGRLQHRRETERQPKGQHEVGGIRRATSLKAGLSPLGNSGRDARAPGGVDPDGEVGGIRRATSLKAGLSPLGNSRLPASRAPAPRDGADPSRR